MIFFKSRQKNQSSNFSLNKVEMIVFLVFLPFLPLLLLSLPLDSFQSPLYLICFLAWFKYFSGFAVNLTLSLISLGFSLNLGGFAFWVFLWVFLPLSACLGGRPEHFPSLPGQQ